MAGVEKKGPRKIFIFRYEYLLHEVGTHMLRMVFHHEVGPNFKMYLDSNPDRKRDYDNLLSSRNILTPVQLQLLPPIDNSPSSDNFDITLLCCLMRNTCGLCSSSDQVWSDPQSTDTRLEADITRLRKHRNELAHSGSVFEDETVLNTKWKDLCEVLRRLAGRCGFSRVNELIQDAEFMEIDEKLQDKWRNEYIADIQKTLIDAYQSDICPSLPLCSLLEYEKVGLLELYEVPTMYVVNYHKVEKQQTDRSSDELSKVKTCSDLFHVKDKYCKNIYLTGDAGVGKTSFCKFLALLWCKSKLGRKLEKVEMQKYIDYLDRFEFVFYVNLRDTDSADVVSIIVNQFFYSENKDNSNRMYAIVKEILGNHDSLVIMDGLDEWTPVPTDPTDKRRYEVPVRPISLKCVYLTTCRPYKIENVRLSETNLDHQVKMTGLGKKEIKAYVSNLINIINSKFEEYKNKEEFMMAVEEVNVLDMLHIPMTTSHLVMLWFDRPFTSMSKSLIYGNIMDMLFKLAHKKEIVIQQSKPSKLKLPDRLSELTHFKYHFSQIEQLCLLSFKLLFEHDTDITSLVFTWDQLASGPYYLSKEETIFFCRIGILSMKKVKRKFGKQEHKLSFLHKSYIEFFAAIYVSSLDKEKVLELFSKCRTVNDVLNNENFIIFYAGLSVENLVSLINEIYSLISTDLRLTRELSIFSDDGFFNNMKNQLDSLQSLILKCYNEGSCHVENSLPLEDFIFHDNRYSINNGIDVETTCLCKLIESNVKNVRLLWSDTGVYHDDFISITSLEVLHIELRDSKYFNAFIELMKQNKSLQILSIESYFMGIFPEFPMLPLEDLQNLTSLSLGGVNMSHKSLQCIEKYLTNNVQLKHLQLKDVRCTEHRYSGKYHSLDLVQCNKLVYLHLDSTDIKCTNINTSSLEYISVDESIHYTREYIKIQGEEEWVDGKNFVDALISSIRHMPKIEKIDLADLTIRDNVGLVLHPDVKQVSIKLERVNMTERWFQTYIGSVVYKLCRIQLDLDKCIYV